MACGTTQTRHAAKGLCWGCYIKKQYNTKSEYKPKMGRWSRDWDTCRMCHTTERKHHAHGLCTACIKKKYTFFHSEENLNALIEKIRDAHTPENVAYTS